MANVKCGGPIKAKDCKGMSQALGGEKRKLESNSTSPKTAKTNFNKKLKLQGLMLQRLSSVQRNATKTRTLTLNDSLAGPRR